MATEDMRRGGREGPATPVQSDDNQNRPVIRSDAWINLASQRQSDARHFVQPQELSTIATLQISSPASVMCGDLFYRAGK